MKKILPLIVILLTLLPVSAQEIKDVRDMGDVWVVTVDKSLSMLDYGNASTIARNVYSRLMSGDCLASADFEKDRFLFLTSGIKFERVSTIGTELKAAAPFDQSFIHATDGILYSFPDKQACAVHVRDLVGGGYKYNLSFVSQIRLFSIVHAVNLLKSRGESASFDGFKVLTITDDADQNDQWMMDYRSLKSWAPKKVQEVNDSTSKYVYNVLNGKGNGNLEEIFADDGKAPHLWVYDYRSKQQDVPESELELLSLNAADGRTIRAVPKTRRIQGDDILFFHVDSLKVNGKVVVSDESFRDTLRKESRFDNAFKLNRTEIRGYAQVEYDDEVFGKHCRIVPFVQKGVALSQKLETLLTVLGILAGLCLLGLLAWLLLIRPNLKLFTIHSALGKKTVVKRGFAKNWKGEYVPIQCYEENREGLVGAIIRKHKDVLVTRDCPAVPDSSAILLVSRRPVNVSVDTIFQTTADDVESIFFSRTGEYSPLLREEYEKTPFHKLYRDYMSAKSEPLQRCIKMGIGLLNFFAKRYYYLIKDITAQDRIYVSCDSLLAGKRFIIENHSITGPTESDVYGDVAQHALAYYYENDTPHYDVLLCNRTTGNEVHWVVVSVNDRLVTRDSLRSVTSHVRFTQTGGTENVSGTATRIMRALEKEFPGKRIGHVDVTGIGNQPPLSFAVKKSTAPGYVSFMESSARRRIQPLYSPIENADMQENFIRLRPRLLDGHLYLSAIPTRFLTTDDPLQKQLSQAVVRTEENQSSVLRLDGAHLEFRDIKVTF